MTICEKCGESIPDKTDDNYDWQGLQIQCEACEHWQDVE